MLEQLKDKIKNAMQGIEFSARTKHICICRASLSRIKMYDETDTPSFLKGEKPKQYLFLMPEISHSLSDREKTKLSAEKLKKHLGDDFEVQICATRNEIIFNEEFSIPV